MKDMHKSMSSKRKKEIENIFNEMFGSMSCLRKITIKKEAKHE